MPSISTITVNWNRREDLTRLLRSIQNQTIRPEIIVVDNGSSDGSIEMIKSKFPHVRLIQLDRNMGLHEGFNRGLAIARGDIIIGLDNDAVIEDKELFAKTLASFDAHADMTFLAYAIHDLTARIPQKSNNPHGIPKARAQDSSFECRGFNGVAFAARRKVFDEIGGFWSELFIYSGEEELAMRAYANGHRSRYFPYSIIYHAQSPVSRSSSRDFFVARNILLTQWRNLPLNLLIRQGFGLFAIIIAIFKYPAINLSFSAFRGILDAIRLLPHALSLRRPLPSSALAAYFRLP